MGPGAGRGTAKAVRGRREEGRGREVAGRGQPRQREHARGQHARGLSFPLCAPACVAKPPEWGAARRGRRRALGEGGTAGVAGAEEGERVHKHVRDRRATDGVRRRDGTEDVPEALVRARRSRGGGRRRRRRLGSRGWRRCRGWRSALRGRREGTAESGPRSDGQTHVSAVSSPRNLGPPQREYDRVHEG